MSIVNYKCPNCDAPLLFSAQSQQWSCEHCGGEFSKEQLESFYAPKEAKAEQASSEPEPFEPETGTEQDADNAHLKLYSCPQCGAEIITDDTTAATICAYCGNTTIMPKQFTGSFKPDYVIPFKLNKQAAIDALKKHYRGKRLLPNTFSSQNQIEKLTGMYVPVWLFDAEASADVSFNATRVHTRRSGNYEITDTQYYLIRRAGSVAFDKVPVDGSTKMDDTLMEAIEPYDYEALEPFTLAYLSGYQADKYDVDGEQSRPRAEERIAVSVVDTLTETVSGYTTVTPDTRTVDTTELHFRQALLPVWMLNTKWNDKNYTFAMNGQTGKLIGDLPIDKGKSWFHFLSCFGLVSVVSTLLIALIA